MNEEDRSHWREQLTRMWSIPMLGRLNMYIRELSLGDRIIFYILTILVGSTSLISLFALEQSLLEKIPAYGGTLIEGEVGNPQFINPLLAISDADRDLSTLTYAGLMGISGSGDLVPVLAERYEVSGDNKTYTFVLRKNAKFTDGTPVTAADVVFTVKKAQDPSLKSPEYANWTGVAVSAIDEQTVRFTLSKAYAPFLGLTTLGILPSRLWQNISDTEFPFSSLETSPVGNGPFKVASISRNASGLIQSVLLTQNPNYVLGRPYLDSIRFNFFSNTEDLARALRSGAVESAYGIPGKNALSAPYARVFGVFFNPNENQIYSRIEIRKALSLAINRQAIVTDALGGYATSIMGPVPPGKNVEQVPVPGSTNPTATASAVLKATGWIYNGKTRAWENAKAKQTFSSVTMRTSNVPELKNVASAVKTDWEKLGITVNIELYEAGDLSQNVIRPRKYEALLYGMVIDRDQDLYAFWDSQERNDPGLNIAMYANKTIDALLEDARSTIDEKARSTDLGKIETLVAADYPAAFLYAPNFIYSLPDEVQGVSLPQIITPADRFATVATWYRSTDAVWPLFAKQK
ncbi:MAG: peptide ABC transporter substrate-binding protein [Candidatus Kaiserbacteria bacterium]|nr:peptide ABC transporter substrate-binding protein [Candidatus Kaiserbacteria bacterium]